MSNNEKLLSALNQFKNSARDISELWQQVDEKIARNLCDDYPFPNDFDEVVYKIEDWVLTQQKLI
ncbi:MULTISPECIES: hypothetical protein [Bacillus subtilis group]|uniref:hypothetical protein n=1 Tax=Bacillus subtilis group TaxID=653685 RepID=UPI00025A97D7|nr:MULTISPECIES: hypothetical protein [Bacillus subtilis group]AKQ73995.1 hypothetical protein MUY_002863 [Bacillus licheniformis WX-02]MDE1392100.1 hypothetical protein [Bacillus paralicheniformis]MEC1037721.1 hypothetical protein [Bacillus licheniformis]QAW38361.1 hypothetical protein ETK49_14165 [Bacillus licheniformis]QSV42537.1 hypothetical protein G6536_14155 [Bacillus licheniformis]